MRTTQAAARALASVLLLATLSACGDDTQVTAFETAKSPDGRWVAKAIDERHFGPGAAGDVLRVTLQLSHRGTPVDVLVLNPSDAEPYPGRPASHVRIRWLSPSALQVECRDAQVGLRMAEFEGVQVSTVTAP